MVGCIGTKLGASSFFLVSQGDADAAGGGPSSAAFPVRAGSEVVHPGLELVTICDAGVAGRGLAYYVTAQVLTYS